MCFVKVLLELLENHQILLTFWDKTGVPDDAKMSQEEEPEDQENSKNQTIKKENKEEKRQIDK